MGYGLDLLALAEELKVTNSIDNSLWTICVLDILRARQERKTRLQLEDFRTLLESMRAVAPLALAETLGIVDDTRGDWSVPEIVCAILARMLNSYRRAGQRKEAREWERFLESHSIPVQNSANSLARTSDIDYAVQVMRPLFKRFL